jgi:hypothetical protein
LSPVVQAHSQVKRHALGVLAAFDLHGVLSVPHNERLVVLLKLALYPTPIDPAIRPVMWYSRPVGIGI